MAIPPHNKAINHRQEEKPIQDCTKKVKCQISKRNLNEYNIINYKIEQLIGISANCNDYDLANYEHCTLTVEWDIYSAELFRVKCNESQMNYSFQ